MKKAVKKEVKKKGDPHMMRNIAFIGVLLLVIIAIIISKGPEEETSLQEMQPNVMQPQETVEEEPEIVEELQEEVVEEVEVIEPPVEEPAPIEITPEEEPEEIIEEAVKATITGVCEDNFIDITLTNTFDEAFSTVGLTWWVSGKLSHSID